VSPWRGPTVLNHERLGQTTVKKARVFFVNRYFYPDESATSQLLSDLAFGLAQSGCDVHIVCSRQLYGTPGAGLPASEVIRGVIVHRLWTTRFGRRNLFGRALDYVSFYATCAVALLRLVRRSDIVVAKTDPPLISLVAVMATRCRGAILVNWLQDVFPEVASALGASPLPAVLDRLLRSWRDASLRVAAANIVIGKRMREYLVGRGIPPNTMHVIENWALANTSRPKDSDESELRARLGLGGKFVVGYSGNLGRAHEHRIFLEAALALQSDGNVQFLFIGGGIRMDALRTMAEQRHLSNMRFLPYQPRESLEDSLAAADVHLVSLLPSLEGLIVPSKFYGVLAAGRPVVFVGDPEGELSRVIRESRCGFVVAVGDSADLAAAIRRLQNDVDQRASMGTAARDLLSARFGAPRALTSWIALVNHLQASPVNAARARVG
jgi:colanic acid biosynthesis glycosyl transferase WcaI